MENVQQREAMGMHQSPETRSRDDLKKAYQLTAVIGGAMISSLFIYAVLVEVIKGDAGTFKGFAPMPEIDTLRYVLLGFSTVEFFLIKFMSNFYLAGKISIPSGYQTGRYSRYTPEIQRLMSGAIISYSLCESVAIYGLILFLIGGSSFDYYLFMALSLVFYAVYFPRYGRWEEWMDERERTGMQRA